MTTTLTNVPPDRLLGLLQEGAEKSGEVWNPHDYTAIWRHQLAAPLVTILSDPQASADHGQIGSIAELLTVAHPPALTVQVVAQHAKACVLQPNGDLPGEVARVLYFLMVWVGRYRCGNHVSSLPDEGLDEGLRWAAKRDWLDEETRRQITAMLQPLRVGSEHN